MGAAGHGCHRRSPRLETIQQTPDWQGDKVLSAEARSLLEPLAARYFLREQRSDGQPIDPVARFHLGNGAILDRLNPAGNLSARGLDEALGLMVNYRYDLSKVEENHEAYVNDGVVTASKPTQRSGEISLATASATRSGCSMTRSWLASSTTSTVARGISADSTSADSTGISASLALNSAWTGVP